MKTTRVVRRRATRAWLAWVLVVGTLVAPTPPAAEAAGTPDITLTKDMAAETLFGDTTSVTLTATNSTATNGYNLSFNDVLPAGVTLDAATPAPTQVIADAPAAGQTTLIWENVSDLPPGATFVISYTLDHSTTTYAVGDSIANSAGAYLNTDPRTVPDFDPVTGVATGDFTGSDTASASTSLIPFQITKNEPNTESELLRGLHDHQTLYSLTVQNNFVNPTNGFVVEDYLPAGLEFLACGDVDNSTTGEEYPGSGVINPGNAPAIPGGTREACIDPSLVETVSVDPDGAGPLPTGVYTHVVWDAATIAAGSGFSSADLAAGEAMTLHYVAAIPDNANTTDWSAATGGEPAPGSGGQAANIDNNVGASTQETGTEIDLTNFTEATGNYSGDSTDYTDDDTETVSAEDVSIHKSVDDGTILQGDDSVWTLLVETSEYVGTSSSIIVTDTVPDGLCPLGAGDSDCAGGAAPSHAYTSATENSDGTYTLVWDFDSIGGLGSMGANETRTITFSTRARSFYQEGFADDTPVLANDSWANQVDLTADVDGRSVVDESEAGQTAGGLAISKDIAEVSAAPVTCGDGAAHAWDPDVAGPYGPGDRVCWLLTVDFPGLLDTGGSGVTDFLPAGFTYESWAVGAANTVPVGDIVFDGSGAASGVLSWTVGDGGGFVDIGNKLEIVVSTVITDPNAASSADLTANLMKMSYTNTAGEVFPLRDEADALWEEPELDLTKGVQEIVGGASTAQGPHGPDVDDLEVQGGDVVTYRVDVTNSGDRDAIETEVWDVLPSQITCAEVSNITTPSGTASCNAGTDTVEWTGVTVAGGATETLTYDVTIPASISAGEMLDNTSGVRQYESPANTGATDTFVFIPSSNIDASQEASANTDPASDDSSVFTASLVVAKARATEVDTIGNGNAQATIGEEVAYTVTVTIPEGTTLNSAVLSDPIPSFVSYLGDAAITLDGGAATGFTLDDSGPITITFPDPYTVAVDDGDKVLELTWTGQVVDDASVTRGDNPANTATVDWLNQLGAAQSESDSVNTRIAEPYLTIAKDEDDADDEVVAGQEYGYTVTVTNDDDPPGTDDFVSIAHDLTIVDTIPTQITPLELPGDPAEDGDTIAPDGGVWDETARTITWTLSSLDPGATATFDYEVRVNDPVVGSINIDNSVTVTGSSLEDPLDNEGERDATSPNGGPGSGYTATATDSVIAPSIALTKSADPSSATIGEEIRYTVTATIPAGVILYQVTLIDDLPVGVAFDSTVSSTCVTGGGGACSPDITVTEIGTDSDVVAWWLGDLATPSTEDRTVTIVYDTHVEDLASVNDGDTLTNSFNVYGDQSDEAGGPPATPPPPSDFDVSGTPVTADVGVVEPSLDIDKDVNGQVGDTDTRRAVPGETLIFTVAVTNDGTRDAHDITVSDATDSRYIAVDVSDGTGYTVTDADPSDGTLGWSIVGPLGVGATVTITYQLQVPAGLDSSDEVDPGAEFVNTADVPSYYGVSSAERTANGFDYRNYDDVTPDQVDIELDLATIGDLVWFDQNGDGVADVGEPGIEGVDVTVTYLGLDGVAGGGDDEVFTTTTAADGSWTVEELPGGNYTVAVDLADLPAGMANPTYDLDDGTTAPDGSTAATLGEDEDKTDVDFGFNGTGSIGDLVWFDRNGDGVQDADEPGFDGIDVTVTWYGPDANPGGGDDVAFTTTTDAAGNYLVDGLPAGNYLVEVDTADLPAGFSAASDLDGTLDDQTTLALAADEDRTDADFGYNGTASIGDTVWLDLDGDGTLDATEPGIEGVIMDLIWEGQDGILGNADDATFQTFTDDSGNYLFDGLPPGDYTVAVTGALPANVVNSFDEDGNLDSMVDVTLSAAENHLTADFGYDGDTSLGDRVWFDLNADGVQDLGEPGIGGVELTLTYAGPDGIFGNADDLTFITTTDANGDYLFMGLPGGDFRVDVTDGIPAGMSTTFDEDDGTVSPDESTVVTGLGTEAHLTADFGYSGNGSLGDFVWLDVNGDGVQDAGEPGLPGIDVTLTWYGADGVLGGTDDVVLTQTTDIDGNYSFANLPAGTFDVTIDPGTVPGGLNPTSDLDGSADGSTVTTLTDGQDRTDVDFGYNGGASIGDTVWFDRNANAVIDADEVGLEGVTVDLTWAGPDGIFGNADDETFSTTTDADGNYLFANLGAGNYTVAVDTATLPTAMVATFDEDGGGDSIIDVTLTDGEAHLTADFGYNGTASIGDTIWLDIDGDGAQGAGEPGVGGQTVELVWPGEDGILGNADDQTFTTTTDADGVYLFDGLPPGDYTVTVVGGVADESVNSFDEDGDLDSATDVGLAAGDNHLTADFGYQGTNSIGDTVWFDLDADGVQGAGEPGLAGVTVSAIWFGPDGVEGTADDVALADTVTDADGLYLFENLPDGSYSVTVGSGIPAGLVSSFDEDGDLDGHTVVAGLSGGAAHLTADFGYAASGSIGDTIWLDVDGNGVQDPGEPGISGVDVTATWAGPDGIIGTADDVDYPATTDADGLYLIENLPDGEWTVVIDVADLPDGYLASTDLDGGDPASTAITLDPGEDQLDVDFAATGDASLEGTVWFDIDGDGVQDSDESGIGGVTVRVTWDGPDGPVTIEVVTDADGNWNLTGLPAGDYTVVVESSTVPGGLVATTDTETSLTLPVGGTGRFDAGYAEPVVIGDLIWIDENGNGIPDPGEPGIEGIEVTLELVDGTVIAVDVTGADGRYRFDGIAPGTYVVRINQATVPDNLTLTVDPDGGTPNFATTVTIASGQEDFTLDFGFQVIEQVPRTGIEATGLSSQALALVLAGVALLVWARRREIAESRQR